MCRAKTMRAGWMFSSAHAARSPSRDGLGPRVCGKSALSLLLSSHVVAQPGGTVQLTQGPDGFREGQGIQRRRLPQEAAHGGHQEAPTGLGAVGCSWPADLGSALFDQLIRETRRQPRPPARPSWVWEWHPEIEGPGSVSSAASEAHV